MTWLLTGGAGYIGAHIVRAFQRAEVPVVVLDDLSTGIRENVPLAVPLVVASVSNTEAVGAALRGHDVTGVLHLAAKKSVGESVEKPLLYWDENVGGMRSLLQTCSDNGVARVLFSSSAAVYGTPPSDLVNEETPTAPVSPYGETKLVGEWILRDLAMAQQLRWAALRYFNVAGAGAPELGDRSISNLVPLTLQALAEGRNPQVFGDDYETRDGTCIRDYIHVVDLAEAHVAAARRLDERDTGEVYNVARGQGVTVKEVLATVRAVTGIDFTYDVVGRRGGDPAAYFAEPTKIGRDLGWTARLDLDDMVRSAWGAWQAR
jgi:UDP-glucose 4-epimerase